MYKMIIVNAPRFFSLTWRIIKGWLDSRTASKIEIFSNKISMKERLLELVDADQLPEDYGGTGQHTIATMKNNIPSGMIRIASKLLSFRIHDSYVFRLDKGEEVDIIVYTRGTYGASLSIYDQHKEKIITGVDVIHKGRENMENEMPTQERLNKSRISGPLNLKIKAETMSGRKSQTFLLVFNVYSQH